MLVLIFINSWELLHIMEIFPSLYFEQYTIMRHASYLTLRLFQPTYSWRLVSVSPNLKPSTSPGLIVSTSTFDGRRHFSSGATVTSLVDSSALNIKQKSVSKVSSTLSKDFKYFFVLSRYMLSIYNDFLPRIYF